ncbi:MAG: TRAP transporter small permease subunit [Candidatus Bathyarchaeia archaeon]
MPQSLRTAVCHIFRIIGWVSVASTAFIMLLLTCDALMTKVLSKPITGTPEIVTVVNVLVVWMVTAFVQVQMGQQRVELYNQLFGKWGRRFIEIASDILGMLVVTFLFWRVCAHTWYLFVSDQRVRGELNFHLWPFGAAMCIGLLLLAVAFLLTLLDKLNTHVEK